MKFEWVFQDDQCCAHSHLVSLNHNDKMVLEDDGFALCSQRQSGIWIVRWVGGWWVRKAIWPLVWCPG